MWLPNQRKNSAKELIDHAIHEAFEVAGRDSQTRLVFEHLLRHVRTTPLLRPPAIGGRLDGGGIRRVVGGLLALACHHTDWLRPIEDWQPTVGGPMPRFGSIALHLLARYPVPAFMTSVWLRDRDAESARQQGWYQHIGLGRNIRTADLPLLYTKRMAHAFLQAPDHFTVEAALRWGQVRGLGGSEALARAVAATRLGRSFQQEAFWLTVLQFLVNHPELDVGHVGPIVEYLHNRRFVPQEQSDGAGGEDPWRPPQPSLSMKGRTMRSLLRQVGQWRGDLGQRVKRTVLRWSRSGIGEFRLMEQGIGGQGVRVWAIRELLSSRELRVEGGAMHHCAANYVGLCCRGRASIWSMTVEDHDGRRRVLTIDVVPATREAVQARRCCNAGPNPKDREILGLWARQQGLKVVC